VFESDTPILSLKFKSDGFMAGGPQQPPTTASEEGWE